MGDPAQKRGFVEADLSGSQIDFAVVFDQGVAQVFFFELREGRAVAEAKVDLDQLGGKLPADRVFVGMVKVFEHPGGEVLSLDQFAFDCRDGIFEHIPELRMFPGPAILFKDAPDLGREMGLGTGKRGGQLRKIGVDQRRHLLATAPKRLELDTDDSQAMEQIFPELLSDYGRAEVPVRGGDDSHVEPALAVAAERGDGAGLKELEKPGLEARSEVAYLVQKDGPALGQLEAADPPLFGSGEGAALVSEELGFERPFVKRGEIDGDEWPAPATALVVDLPREAGLTRAGGTSDQDVGVSARRDPQRVRLIRYGKLTARHLHR